MVKNRAADNLAAEDPNPRNVLFFFFLQCYHIYVGIFVHSIIIVGVKR
jgi:hypothetical protein